MQFAQSSVDRQRKLNQSVTFAHIALILGYTVVSILSFNVKRFSGQGEKPNAGVYRAATWWSLFGGASDIFLSCMIWLIFDEESAPTVFRDERHNSTYAVLDIIKSFDSLKSSVNSTLDQAH